VVAVPARRALAPPCPHTGLPIHAGAACLALSGVERGSGLAQVSGKGSPYPTGTLSPFLRASLPLRITHGM